MPPNSTVLELNRQDTVDRRAAPEERVEALDRKTIAEMSSRELHRMNREELTRVVRASPLPPLHARLEYLDRATLERLGYLARLCCQNRR